MSTKTVSFQRRYDLKYIGYLIAFCILLLTPLSSHQAEYSDKKIGDMTVIVSNLKNNNGKVRIGISDSKENYETKGAEPLRRIVSTITDRSAEVVFKNLPFGEYAIKVIHDENGNDKLDTNFLGIHKEEYAFSNNASGWFGPPHYEKAKFKFNMNMAIRITIKSDRD